MVFWVYHGLPSGSGNETWQWNIFLSYHGFPHENGGFHGISQPWWPEGTTTGSDGASARFHATGAIWRHDRVVPATWLVPAGAIAQDRTWFTMIDYSITSTRWKLYILNEFNWCLYIDFSIRLDMYGHLSLALSLSISGNLWVPVFCCFAYYSLPAINCTAPAWTEWTRSNSCIIAIWRNATLHQPTPSEGIRGICLQYIRWHQLVYLFRYQIKGS